MSDQSEQPDQTGAPAAGTWGDREGMKWGDFEPNAAVAESDPANAMGLPEIPTERHTADQLKGNATRLTDELTEMLRQGAIKYGQDERCRVDVALTLVPTPQGPATFYLLYLDTPGMLLGTTVSVSTAIPVQEDAPWTQEYADEFARQLWELARQQRSGQPERLEAQRRAAEQQMVAQAAAMAQQNGAQPPAGGGLIFPGSGI